MQKNTPITPHNSCKSCSIESPSIPKKIINNLLTFDIEGFIESSHDIMSVPSKYISKELEFKEIEVNTMKIIEILSDLDQKATFFVLGRIARDMPSLVRRIASEGHEIGCHGFYHRRLFNYSREETFKLLSDAKHALEDVTGKPIYGFRAPDFSIVKSNQWVFDTLKELQYVYDSSVYPTGLHDVYGIDDFPRGPCFLPNGLIEISMSTVNFLGIRIPFGGGGYLRLYPYLITKLLFFKINRERIPGIIYLHPVEMGQVVPKIEEMRLLRKVRTYIGISSVQSKLKKFIKYLPFTRVIDYIKEECDWRG